MVRAACWTWLAVLGRQATKIRDLLANTHTKMTDHCLRDVSVLRGRPYGEPFPAFPIIVKRRVSDDSTLRKLPVSNEFLPGGRDSKTPETSDSRGIHVDLGRNDPPRVDVSARELVASGPSKSTELRGGCARASNRGRGGSRTMGRRRAAREGTRSTTACGDGRGLIGRRASETRADEIGFQIKSVRPVGL
jgi:hypothetical protein